MMNRSIALLTLVSALLMSTVVHGADATRLRVVAYNVACGQWATPEQIAELLKPLKPDIVLLSEVPKANQGKDVKDWSSKALSNEVKVWGLRRAKGLSVKCRVEGERVPLGLPPIKMRDSE